MNLPPLFKCDSCVRQYLTEYEALTCGIDCAHTALQGYRDEPRLERLRTLRERLDKLEVFICGTTADVHLQHVVEARKCCLYLAATANEHQPIEVERLIDAADQLAERYADKFLSHLSKEQRHEEAETLVAAQARKVMDYIVKVTK